MNTVPSTKPIAPLDPKADPKHRGMFVLPDGRNVATTFFLVVLLFALWGFCTGLIDVMDKHFQNVYHFTLAQSAWVQTAHYLGYFVMAIPAGFLATRLGYKGGIITGLLMVAVGGFWFVPASHIGSFWAFLLGVCIIAAGLAFLETIANPYTTVLGPQPTAATRINLAQSCNGIGLLCGPIVGSVFFYSKNAAGVSTGSERLWIPYFALAIVVLVLALVFFLAEVPEVKGEDDYHVEDALPGAPHSIWTRHHFSAAVAAQFLYVAAQAGIFSFFINYMTSETPAVPHGWETTLGHFHAWLSGLLGEWPTGWLTGWFETRDNGMFRISDKGGANLASVGFFFFLFGRFIGTGILKKFAAHTTLGVFAATSALLCLLIFFNLGWTSVVCVFLTYFFMSIMFPTIFALGIFGLGQGAKRAASFIVMAIIGGAVVPKFVMGPVADASTLSHAFIVPVACFLFVAAYAFLWPRLAGAEGIRGVSTTGGH